MIPPALRLRGVSVRFDDRTVLHDIDWEVAPGERWVVLGANGSGKTTLLRVASLYLHPTSGVVDVLGATLGRVDVRQHRRRIGIVSAALSDLLRPTIEARDVVMTAAHAALEPWWHEYTDADRQRAQSLLARMGCGHLGAQPFGTLSSGERQRVQLARSLMASPELLLLDEPMAGLDLGGREDVVGRLGDLAVDPMTPPVVLVTHHVDEVPAGFTHGLLLRAGAVGAAGPIDQVLTNERLSACFGLPLAVTRHGNRWSARAV